MSGFGLIGDPCCGSNDLTVCYAYQQYTPPADIGQIGYERTAGAGVGETGILTNSWTDDTYKYANQILALDRLNGTRSVKYDTVLTIPPAGESIDCRGLTLEPGDEIRFRTRTWNNTNSSVTIGSETLTTGTTAWQWSQPYYVGTGLTELPVTVEYDTTGTQNDTWQMWVYVNGVRQLICDDWFSRSGGATLETVEATLLTLPDGSQEVTIDGIVVPEGSPEWDTFFAKKDAGVLLAVPCGLVGGANGKIEKSISPQFPGDGDPVTFTVDFDVTQNDAGLPVEVRDILAANYTFVSASSTVGAVDSSDPYGAGIVVDLGSAPAGTSGTLTIEAIKVGTDANINKTTLEFDGTPLAQAILSTNGQLVDPPEEECPPGHICAPYTTDAGVTVVSTYSCVDGSWVNEYGDIKTVEELIDAEVDCECTGPCSTCKATFIQAATNIQFNGQTFASFADLRTYLANNLLGDVQTDCPEPAPPPATQPLTGPTYFSSISMSPDPGDFTTNQPKENIIDGNMSSGWTALTQPIILPLTVTVDLVSPLDIDAIVLRNDLGVSGDSATDVDWVFKDAAGNIVHTQNETYGDGNITYTRPLTSTAINVASIEMVINAVSTTGNTGTDLQLSEIGVEGGPTSVVNCNTVVSLWSCGTTDPAMLVDGVAPVWDCVAGIELPQVCPTFNPVWTDSQNGSCQALQLEAMTGIAPITVSVTREDGTTVTFTDQPFFIDGFSGNAEATITVTSGNGCETNQIISNSKTANELLYQGSANEIPVAQTVLAGGTTQLNTTDYQASVWKATGTSTWWAATTTTELVELRYGSTGDESTLRLYGDPVTDPCATTIEWAAYLQEVNAMLPSDEFRIYMQWIDPNTGGAVPGTLQILETVNGDFGNLQTSGTYTIPAGIPAGAQPTLLFFSDTGGSARQHRVILNANTSMTAV